MFLNFISRKDSLWLGSCKKLSAKFCGPFEVLSKIGSVAYEIALPPTVKVDIVFHVSLLKRYVYDSNHILYWSMIQVETEGEFPTQRICILDQRIKTLRSRSIVQVKVQWSQYNLEEATWELEDQMGEEYPHLF